jgi:sporulation protein YlmC with PRC-barrel domain
MAKAPLSKLDDWQLEHDEQNIYGWPVTDSAGSIHGKVSELIVDTDEERVVEIVTDTGERFDPHDVDILDNVVSLHRIDGTQRSGVHIYEIPPNAPPAGESHTSGLPVEAGTTSGSEESGSSHVGASMASASPEEGNVLPTSESGPPTIQAGTAAASGAMVAASMPERRRLSIRRIALDHQLPDAQQPPDHQLEA